VDAAYIPDSSEVVATWESSLREHFEIITADGADAKEALRREALRIRPAREGRGARDALIWTTVVRHARLGNKLHLVSNNTGDFGYPKKSELHADLAAELIEPPLALSYHSSLDSFIEEHAIKGCFVFSDTATLREFLLLDIAEEIAELVSNLPERARLTIGNEEAQTLTINELKIANSYEVERVGLAVIRFSGELAVTDLDLAINGTCWVEYSIDSNEIRSAELVTVQAKANPPSESFMNSKDTGAAFSP
jgi:hypothetical protein